MSKKQIFGILVGLIVIILISIQVKSCYRNLVMESLKKSGFVEKLQDGSKAKRDSLDEVYVIGIKAEIDFIKNDFFGSGYWKSLAGINQELALFYKWKNDINGIRYRSVDLGKSMSSDLRDLVIQTQVREFPKMREAYGKLMSEKMWENDVYITTSGDRNTIINISGFIFGANKNISDVQKIVFEVVSKLRFKEIRYRSYKGSDQFVFYKTDSPPDKEL